MSKNLSNFSQSWLKNIKRSYIQMLIIFILFTEKDATGYAITENLKSRLGIIFAISAGSIYPQLNKLEEDGLIKSEVKYLSFTDIRPNEPRKVYNITNYGRSIVVELENLWNELNVFTFTYLDELRTFRDDNAK